MDAYERLTQQLDQLPLSPHPNDTPLCAQSPADCRLHAALLSDLHVSERHLEQTDCIRASLPDLAASQTPIDLLTFGGDLTDNGRPAEYRFLTESLRGLSTVRHIAPVTGNHDIRFGTFSSTVQKFTAFCEAVNPALKVQKLWYSYQVNGYCFLILGSTQKRFEEAALSENELIWLDEQLWRRKADGKPVFVMLHQPLKLTHHLPYSWDVPGTKAGSVGAQSDRLRAVLRQHPCVFLLTGHLHRGFNAYTYEETDGIHCISIPSAGLNNKDSEFAQTGLGFMLEIYDDRVVFRPRDFVNGSYISAYEKTFLL